MADRAFQTTRWTVVLQAAGDTQEGVGALESLCQTYWYPIYAYLRRREHSAHDAQDLTQGFFAYVLEREHLKNVRKEKGRFRAYLLTAIKHYVISEHRKSQAEKRGGGRAVHVSIDEADGEQRYGQQPVEHETPESIYEKTWALAIIEHVMTSLAAEFNAVGKGALFEALKPHLVQEPDRESHAEIAERHGMTIGATTMVLYRMRERYTELLRASVADTVATKEEIDDEIRFLIGRLS